MLGYFGVNMILVKDFDAFVEEEGLDITDNTRETASVRIDVNRLKYMRYLSYKTGKTLSEIINDNICLNREEFSSPILCGTANNEVYAVTHPALS